MLKRITRFIEAKLGLKVNTEKSKISRPRETKYLGYTFYYSYSKEVYPPKMHKDSVRKIQRKLKAFTKLNRSISLDERIQQLQYVIRSWVNYFKLGDMVEVLKNLNAKLRSRIRVIIWKHWKKSATRIRNLKKLGPPEEEAKGLTYCRKSYRYIAQSKVVQKSALK